MSESRFRNLALEAGFTADQVEFLIEHVSHPGHHHSAKQIDDLEEAVENIVSEEDEDEDYGGEEEDAEIHAAASWDGEDE